MYEFSIPMLYDKSFIDLIVELNSTLTKSNITGFYDGLPGNSDYTTGFEQGRDSNLKFNTLDDFLDYVRYVCERGFKFVYLLNSTFAINMNDRNEYKKVCEKIDVVVNSLRNAGCNTFRVGNTSLIQYLYDKYPDIDIITSTVLGYTDIMQYKNLFKVYPKIKKLCLCYENNRNFRLIENLEKSFPNIKKEVMINELCIKGCHLRNSHYSVTYSNFPKIYMENICEQFLNNCGKIFYSDFWLSICRSNVIFPWMIKEYSKFGINNFKMVGRLYDLEQIKYNYEYIFNYLQAIEDEEMAKNMSFFRFCDPRKFCVPGYPNIKVKEIIDYLPDVEHFIRCGHLCDSVCEAECNYCAEKAKILNEKYPLKF